MQLDFNAVAQVRAEGLRKVSTRQSIELATEYMLEHFSEDITIDDLALAARTSKFNLCRIFSRTYGITPIKLLWEFRGRLAKTYIQAAPDLDLTDIAFLCGFASSAHFSRYMRKVCDMPPSLLRDKVKDSCASLEFSTFSNGELFDPNRSLLKKTLSQCLPSSFLGLGS